MVVKMNTQVKQPQPMTAQEVYLHEMMSDFFEARNEIKTSLEESKQIRAEFSQLFSEMEKSISVMNTQIEESIKKHGDKSTTALTSKSDAVLELMAVKLNTILQQASAYQTEGLTKIQKFFVENLAVQSNKELESVKAEIEKEKVKAIKEITVAINRVNGGNLIKPALIFAVLLGFVFGISTSYFTIYLFKENFAPSIQTSSPQTTSAATSGKRK